LIIIVTGEFSKMKSMSLMGVCVFVVNVKWALLLLSEKDC
jgi:hypothetical protein